MASARLARWAHPFSQGWLMSISRALYRVCSEVEKAYLGDDIMPEWITPEIIQRAWEGHKVDRDWRPQSDSEAVWVVPPQKKIGQQRCFFCLRGD